MQSPSPVLHLPQSTVGLPLTDLFAATAAPCFLLAAEQLSPCFDVPPLPPLAFHTGGGFSPHTPFPSLLNQVGGLGGFYAGVVPTLIAMFPYVGVEFMVYETLKRRWEVWAGAPAGTLALLMLGAVGGACAQVRLARGGGGGEGYHAGRVQGDEPQTLRIHLYLATAGPGRRGAIHGC
jgi:hypothetical protein